MKFESRNPATDELIEVYHQHSDQELQTILEKGNHAFLEWRMLYLYTRAKYIKKLASVIREQKSTLAALVTLEMGKPLRQAEAEVEKCASMADYYAHNGPEFLKDQVVETEYKKSFVTFQPLGIILGIMPWNFPLWQVLRFAVPVILAGNTVLLKHAPNVTGAALAIEKLFLAAGFPEGIFSTIIIDVPRVPAILENPYVQGVSLTGSETAGRKVSELAGRNLKKAVMELGGSDPYIIFSDADLEKSVETCVASRLINCGQTCISAKRFLVDETIADSFEKMFVEKMKAQVMGDPQDNVDMGPMARKDLRDNLHEQVEKSIDKGARLLAGGEIPDSSGYYYPATVLSGIKETMPVWQEETFGPVAAITRFSTELEALRIANDTNYGLGAALFSSDHERMEKLAKYKINAGSVFINEFVKSDPRLPFGGIKASGFGRELGKFGLFEFVNIKTVVVK